MNKETKLNKLTNIPFIVCVFDRLDAPEAWSAPRTHTHTHTRKHIHTRTHTRTLTHTHAHTHTRAQTHIHTRTHTRTHTLARTHTHTHTRKHIHTRTHTLQPEEQRLSCGLYFQHFIIKHVQQFSNCKDGILQQSTDD